MSSLNEATARNLKRKSTYADNVQLHDGLPLFSWIDVNLTELCNRRCVFCPRVDESFYPNQPLHMSLSLAEKMALELRQLKYEGAVVLSGFGEPLLHPDILEIVKSFGYDVRLEIVTNGDRLDPDLTSKLIQAGVNYFVVSLYDGPHQIEYFEKLFTKEVGVGTDYYTLRDRWYDESKDFGLKLTNRAGTINAGHQDPVITDRFCYYLVYSMMVDWNGDVLLCVQDWRKRLKMGNLYESSLFEVWTGPVMSSHRSRITLGKRTRSPCKECNANGTLHGANHVKAWFDR